MIESLKRFQALLLTAVLSLSLTACTETVPVVDEESFPLQEMMGGETALTDSTGTDVYAKNEGLLDEDGFYTTCDDVALYLTTYDHLPDNFITKREAEELGWSGGGLDDYAYGCCIGGDRFGNYESLLPEAEDRTYTECDIDTMHASSRGAKRLVFSNDGLIYYTEDHYESFTQLYGEEDP